MKTKFISNNSSECNHSTLAIETKLEDSYEYQINEIKKLKDYFPKKALIKIAELLETPENQTSELYNLKLDIFAMLNRQTEAQELFTELCAKKLDNAKTHYRYALLHFYNKDYRQAINLAQSARWQSTELQLLIYRALNSAGKLRQAEKFLMGNMAISEQEKLLASYEVALSTNNIINQKEILLKLRKYLVYVKPLKEPLKLVFTEHFNKMAESRQIDLDLLIDKLATQEFRCIKINQYYNYIYLNQQNCLYKISLRKKHCLTIFKEIDIHWKLRFLGYLNSAINRISQLFTKEMA